MSNNAKGSFKKNVQYCFRFFISNNFVRKIARLIHINNLGKKVYFKLFVPKNAKISHSVDGISAQLYIKNYTGMIYLTETISGQGDEDHIISFLLKNIKKGDVIYDIGAFIGLHTIFFAKSVGEKGKVIAFEPSFCSYAELKNNIELNGLNNVMPINIALGNISGKGIISGDDMSMRSLSKLSENGGSDQEITIIPGDLIIQRERMPRPNVIKIDVEGYEYNVFKGLENTLKQDSCRFVCCEVHPALLPLGAKPEMIVVLLNDFGFTEVKTYPRGNTFHIFFHKV